MQITNEKKLGVESQKKTELREQFRKKIFIQTGRIIKLPDRNAI